MKSLVQGNAGGDRTQTFALKDCSRGPCGYQSQVTGPGGGEVSGHKTTLTLISQTGPAVFTAISQGAPSRAWTFWAMPPSKADLPTVTSAWMLWLQGRSVVWLGL